MVKLWCSASDGIRVPARPAQHVHRRVFQTCDAGRARVYLPSEAGTPDTTIERDDADHAGARPYLRRRGTSIKANKYHICCTRVNAHGRSRKRPSRRATPDRAGARPYHSGGKIFTASLMLTRMCSAVQGARPYRRLRRSGSHQRGDNEEAPCKAGPFNLVATRAI
jgi:hypothetical protein